MAAGLRVPARGSLRPRGHGLSVARVEIRIPSALHSRAGGRSSLKIDAPTVRTALDTLEVEYPAVARCVRDEQGSIRRHVHLFHGKNIVRGLIRRGHSDADIAKIAGGNALAFFRRVMR